ncbi:MAG TPA: SIMPL domain-containing protein [Candidatus Nitrosotenuis sp.]|nr:SIMPL domain-containing protein [Candidatus Nitrosotenuis sp.]
MDSKDTGGHSNKQKLNIPLDLRLVSLGLALVILGMLAFWRPWEVNANANDQVVEVTGEAKLSATPDEYVFYPMYQFSNADKQAGLSELSAKSQQVVGELKKLGVDDEKIKTNTNGYDYPAVLEDKEGERSYNLQLTVTVADKELAQKVQDYLVTTSPTGGISPQASFSEAKRKQLESAARDQATKDARNKADQMAKNLGFSVGKVKSVSDSQGFGISPIYQRDIATSSLEMEPQLDLQAGENELNYSVKVTYYIR